MHTRCNRDANAAQVTALARARFGLRWTHGLESPPATALSEIGRPERRAGSGIRVTSENGAKITAARYQSNPCA